jgi:glycosyltransferase involved in cell wall biosynthesis
VTPLRILVLNWRDPKHPQGGGAEAYLFEQAKRWAAWGHRVQWLSAGFAGGAARETLEGVAIRRAGNAVTVYPMVAWTYLREFRGQFDVVVDSENGIPFFSPLYAREPQICVVYHVHREVFRKHLPAVLAYPLMWCEEKLVPLLYRKARFVTISQDTRGQMEELKISPHEIGLVRCGVEKELVPGPKSPEPSVVYLGRLKAYKRVDVLIEAFARVKRAVPDAVLRLAGTGDARPALEELVRSLQLQDAVTFEGFVDDARKQQLLASAWVTVAPSEMEGWGITAIESNACGTPAIAFRVPGLGEAIVDGESGILVPEGGDLAPAIVSVLSDPALRARLERGALERAQAFSWDSSAHAMLDEIALVLR